MALVLAVFVCATLVGGAVAAAPDRAMARGGGGARLAQGFTDAGRAIVGAVDADAVVLADGRLRMYYGTGAPGSATSRITSSISTNGTRWTRESTNLPGPTWGAPDVVRLLDGRFRMYFTPALDPVLPRGQQLSVKSAISDDGIHWTVEPGYRLNPAAFPQLIPHRGIQYHVTHPGVVQLADGTWLMLAAYSIQRGFDPHGVSSARKTELIVWATSKDGLTFTARGIAVDSRNKATFDGYASSPDPVLWSDGRVRAFFWSPGSAVARNQMRYSGIMSTTFTGRGWTTPEPVRTSAAFPEAFAGGDGGSDPTSALFKGRALLFHGHGGEDNGVSHEVLDYSIMTSEVHRLTVSRPARSGTIESGIALGASPPRTDGSTGMTCGSRNCSATVFVGTRMWLYARPAPGYQFAGWSGCNIKRPPDYPRPLPEVKLCWVKVTTNTSVAARFVRATPAF